MVPRCNLLYHFSIIHSSLSSEVMFLLFVGRLVSNLWRWCH